MCGVDMRKYPFDTQSCSMHFYATDETRETVTLFVKTGNLTEYSESTEWILHDVNADIVIEHTATIGRVTFELERRSKFTVYTVIMPVAALTLINVGSFLLPIESGEKGGLSVTVFLTYAFFIIISRDALPHNAVAISHYISYLACALILSVISVIYVIIESKLYHELGDKQFELAFFHTLFRRRRNGTKIHVDVEQKKNRSTKKDLSKSSGKTVDKEESGLTWAVILRRVDNVAFVVALLFTVISSTVFAINIHSH